MINGGWGLGLEKKKRGRIMEIRKQESRVRTNQRNRISRKRGQIENAGRGIAQTGESGSERLETRKA